MLALRPSMHRIVLSNQREGNGSRV